MWENIEQDEKTKQNKTPSSSVFVYTGAVTDSVSRSVANKRPLTQLKQVIHVYKSFDI